MRALYLISLCVFISACAHTIVEREPSSKIENGILPISKVLVENKSAIVEWKDISGYQSTDIDVMKLNPVKLDCRDSKLYPTHPQQTTKLYHLVRSALYDYSLLKAEDPACKIKSKYKNAKGVLGCVAADRLEYAVISDTFEDSCGHHYRGVWDVAFFVRDESMGSLLSKGRTVYPQPDSPFQNDMYVGDTYPVDKSEFLFLTDLFSADAEKIKAQKNAAEATHEYLPQSQIFKYIGNNLKN